MPDSVFPDRHILITGGSRGIGRAASLRLAGEGARVTVNYIADEASTAGTVAAIESAGGIAVAVQGDVAIPKNALRIAEEARKAHGPIDMLVHSAGISIVQHATDATWDAWRKTMDVNLDGTFNMVQAVKDEMIQREYGRIVLLSSIAALRQRENQVHYSASKAAVIAMTRCYAQAWAKHNVRVNCICPGLIETDMISTIAPDIQQALVDDTPMRRKGESHEIASVIRFLLSDESSFMTGQAVVASGGRVMIPG